MFRRSPAYQRAPDAHKTPHIHRAQVPVGRVSDSQRDPVFLAETDGQRGPDCPDVLFCRFHNIFHDLCDGFGCLRLSLGPRGPSALGSPKPQGGTHPLRPPPLATSLARKAVI